MKQQRALVLTLTVKYVGKIARRFKRVGVVFAENVVSLCQALIIQQQRAIVLAHACSKIRRLTHSSHCNQQKKGSLMGSRGVLSLKNTRIDISVLSQYDDDLLIPIISNQKDNE
jgi:hypothetical protein